MSVITSSEVQIDWSATLVCSIHFLEAEKMSPVLLWMFSLQGFVYHCG